MFREVLYSALHVMLLCSVTSIPMNGANASVMVTMGMLYMDEGMTLLFVGSMMNPSSPSVCIQLLYVE